MEPSLEAESPDLWKQSVAVFVVGHLPEAPSRVLDVGCGEGWLTRRLAERGYEVLGVDPKAPEDRLFRRMALEDFSHPQPFDAIVAILSLHHIPDLEAAVRKIGELLETGGRLVVLEFAWDRFDDATAGWCLDRLPPELDEENWLHRRCGELHRRLREGRPLQARDTFHQWAAEEGFRSSSDILGALRISFKERSFSWSPYLFPDLKGVTEGEEADAIESGAIQAVGFRFTAEKNG